MKKLIISLLFISLFSAPYLYAANPKVLMQTNQGDIELELFADKAPATVKNMLAYIDSGFYDGTIFHRVIPRFMVQGGGFTQDMKKKSTRAPVKNEAENKLPNVKGTIAMARTSDPHSATAQFFINTKNNDFLNFRDKTPRAWGYAVFGKVTKGMDIVSKIERVKTDKKGRMSNVPVDSVIITKMTLIK